MGIPRPFLTRFFRRAAFNSIRNLAYPGIKEMIKLISQRYVWPSMTVDVLGRNWVRTCVQCQRAKITRYVTAPLGTFARPSKKFDHVHLDIICRNAVLGRKKILLYLRRSFQAMVRDISVGRSKSGDCGQSILWRMDLPNWVTTAQGRQFEHISSATWANWREHRIWEQHPPPSISKWHDGKVSSPAHGSSKISRK